MHRRPAASSAQPFQPHSLTRPLTLLTAPPRQPPARAFLSQTEPGSRLTANFAPYDQFEVAVPMEVAGTCLQEVRWGWDGCWCCGWAGAALSCGSGSGWSWGWGRLSLGHVYGCTCLCKGAILLLTISYHRNRQKRMEPPLYALAPAPLPAYLPPPPPLCRAVPPDTFLLITPCFPHPPAA